jgi:hypothetical protein
MIFRNERKRCGTSTSHIQISANCEFGESRFAMMRRQSMEDDMNVKEIASRLAEIQVALLRDHGTPKGLSEMSRQNVAKLVSQLKKDLAHA